MNSHADRNAQHIHEQMPTLRVGHTADLHHWASGQVFPRQNEAATIAT
jgi:hypothetical protein